jgi:hypothetical protein
MVSFVASSKDRLSRYRSSQYWEDTDHAAIASTIEDRRSRFSQFRVLGDRDICATSAPRWGWMKLSPVVIGV